MQQSRRETPVVPLFSCLRGAKAFVSRPLEGRIKSYSCQMPNVISMSSPTFAGLGTQILNTSVEIQKDLYAWVAVFLLPVNSALNPVLYTLTTKLFKQHLAKIVYSCRAPAHAANDTSGISLTSILHHRNSKKTLVTTFSERDHNSSNRTSLLVPDSPASIRATNCTHKRKDFPSYLKEDMI
ncbi:relaxin receptor 2 [Trichonephila inaurata madagascariensis]|uniref:Relaxin receptor 2 n=1 Tax=Trichonephila inaurata madagascariensis TaxID=2747483 RepID=A0A8X6YD11_9ARAC|nr:relaxin receptor 2 [Trichonephila inaurata madagascariensis]